MRYDDSRKIERVLPDGRKCITILPIEAKNIPSNQVIALICAIPKGRITCAEAMQEYFKAMYQTERVSLNYEHLYIDHVGDMEIPNWRVVSKRGHVSAYWSAAKIKRLESEGVIIETHGTASRSIIIKDYKKLMYPLANIPFDMIRNTNIPETTSMEEHINQLIKSANLSATQMKSEAGNRNMDESDNTVYTGIYRHYKGGIYKVITTASHSETLEDMVVYQSIETEKCWVRPTSMWNEIVEHDGIREPRFKYLALSMDDMDSKALFKTIEDIVLLYESQDILSDNVLFAYCNKETGEVIELTPNIGGYIDGDISEDELEKHEKERLPQVSAILCNDNDYVRLPYDGIWDDYEIMSDFASELPGRDCEKLKNALMGKGAFRRYKDAVVRLGLSEHWYTYHDSRIRRGVREWCECTGVKWSNTFIK